MCLLHLRPAGRAGATTGRPRGHKCVFFFPVLFKSSVEVLRGKTDWRSQHGAVTHAIDIIDWHSRRGSGELLAHQIALAQIRGRPIVNYQRHSATCRPGIRTAVTFYCFSLEMIVEECLQKEKQRKKRKKETVLWRWPFDLIGPLERDRNEAWPIT